MEWREEKTIRRVGFLARKLPVLAAGRGEREPPYEPPYELPCEPDIALPPCPVTVT